MNKHLKPGVAVDVRGASDEDVKAVIEACVELGAYRSLVHGVPVGDFVIWDGENDVWICYDDSEGRPVISINQALGRESEVEKNDWLSTMDGLPPAGAECEVMNPQLDNAQWEKCKILYMGKFICVYESESCLERSGNHDLYNIQFRPLKTEKEKFVERLVLIMNDNTNATFTEISGILYDKGLRFTDIKD